MVNLSTKFEIPSFTRYGDIKDVKNAQNGVVWGGQGSSKVIGNVAIRQSACDFLFDFNRNYASILYRFRDTARHLSKFVDFTLPHLHLAPPLGVTPFEFRKYFRQHKARVPGLSCGVICMVLCIAVLIQYRLVTDTQTDRHMTTANTTLTQRRAVKTVTQQRYV